MGSSSESLSLVSDATAVAFRPDGGEVAVASLNGHITFFDARTSAQTGVIEGRKDLGSGRADADLVTAKKSLQVRDVLKKGLWALVGWVLLCFLGVLD